MLIISGFVLFVDLVKMVDVKSDFCLGRFFGFLLMNRDLFFVMIIDMLLDFILIIDVIDVCFLYGMN